MYLYVARDELGRIVDTKLLKEFHNTPEKRMAIFASSPSTCKIVLVPVWELKDFSSDDLDNLQEILNNRSIDFRRAILLAFTACIEMGIELGTEQVPSMLC